IRMFEALGVWPFLAAHAQPINGILVTDAGLGRAPSPFTLHFDHREIGQPMGHIAENRHIRRSLYEAVAATDGIALVAPAVAREFAITEGGVTADLGSYGEVSARLMVAAEGRESTSRE